MEERSRMWSGARARRSPLVAIVLAGACLSHVLICFAPWNHLRRPRADLALGARSSDLEEEAKIRQSLEGGKSASLRHGAVAAGHEDGEQGAAATTEDEAKASSFEDAQVLGKKLGMVLAASCAAGEPMPEEAVKLLRALVSTTAGARGWFVTLLTDPAFDAVFQSPVDESLLDAISASPEPNIRLMTMNVAMSTATELAHLERGNPDLAAASRMTRDRSTVLLAELLDRLPGLRESVEALLSAVQPGEAEPAEEWVKFCRKWGYNAEQKEAIRKQIEPLLVREG
eukprot:CAMPEP_0115351638 /NCGR_PEP_ID=MMETSP0270-20121206/97095_1 /TAXON_ID=71861 /ORGANISM="Scrippsiella trochoidea, Strain CCMP3099" /LENGTH=284 /DNA_ID=CAMNT_0002773789 /DNA_START=15 /DNA_END=870 /DNA_ORIENTATION=-